MKPWKAAVAVVAVGLVILVVLIAIGGIGVSKKNTAKRTDKVVQSSSSSKNPLKGYNSKPQKELPKVSESSSSSSSSEISSSSSSIEKRSEPKASSGLVSTDYPEFASKGSSKAVISGKKIYKLNNSYVFCLFITVPTEELGTVEVEYFTSSNDYNSVKIGSLLSVDYGISTDKVVAITSAKPI